MSAGVLLDCRRGPTVGVALAQHRVDGAALHAVVAGADRFLGHLRRGVLAEPGAFQDAVDAANEASKEHPCRVVVVARGLKRAGTRLDAQIRVGGDAGASEVLVLRLYGPLADHGDSVLVPLLLPDCPVVAYWPGAAPAIPAEDPIGKLAQRRITDSAAAHQPIKALESRRGSYAEGDTDLAWTRLTPWRSTVR